MRFRSYELNQGSKEFLPKTRMFLEKEYEERIQMEQNVSALELSVDQLERKLSILTVQNEHLNETISSQNARIKDKEAEIEDLRSKYHQLLHKHDLIKLEQRAESAYLIENQHLRHDNMKLVEMMRSTKEFKDWADRADDSVGTLRFLKNLESHELISQKGYVHYCACNPKAVVDNEKWIPESAYKLALELMERNNWTLNEKLLDELLYTISKFYSDREKNLISYLKKSNLAEVQELKRKLNSQEKHPEKAELERLKRGMDQAIRQNIRLTFKQRMPLDEERILKTTVKAVGELAKSSARLKQARLASRDGRVKGLREGLSETIHV